jgi:hypothetical protein
MFYLTDPFIKMIKGMSWESLLSPRDNRPKRSETELIEVFCGTRHRNCRRRKKKCRRAAEMIND